MGAAAAVLAVVFAWVLFVPAADWLARQDIGNAAGVSLETARNNARGNLLALTAGSAALGALIFTARNFALQRRTLELAEEGQRRTLELAEQGQRRTQELAEQGQVTDRYSKAIEHLGSEKLDIRIGGIYALERIARDSARDHPTVIEVLTAFIREHSPTSEIPVNGNVISPQPLQADIHAAVRVIGRRDPSKDIGQINLTKTNLYGADLYNASLNDADLTEAYLGNAELADAYLDNVMLNGANLTGADLNGADLNGANLNSANLTGANLTRANLTAAQLFEANLTETDLTAAKLAYANLNGADMTRSNPSGADWTEAGLEGAIWPSFPVPAGWQVGDNGSNQARRNDQTCLIRSEITLSASADSAI